MPHRDAGVTARCGYAVSASHPWLSNGHRREGYIKVLRPRTIMLQL